MKATFFPNHGKSPIEISSTEDIKKYYGEIMDGFDDVEIVGDKVLLRKGRDYPICLGRLEIISY